MAGEADLAAEVITGIRTIFASVAVYLALIVRNNPYGGPGALLSRPDVNAVLSEAFAEARALAQQAVQDAWDQFSPSADALLAELLADVGRAFNAAALAHLRGDIRRAYRSVPPRQFIPGTTPPGTNPGREAAEERAQAVQEAVEDFARRAALRCSLSADVAWGDARTLAQLEGAAPGLRKRWRTSKQPPDEHTCWWCRKLNGVTIPLNESFESYLGPAADLTGHGHLTQPPHSYHGWLQGPLLHPHCRCHLELVAAEDVSQAGEETAVPAGFVFAEEIRAMPEGRYRALVEFLRAAVHELGQALRVLGRLVRRD